MTSSRREFVFRLAKGTAWSVPVIRTLAAPESLLAQGQSQNSQKGGMGMMNMGMNNAAVADPGSRSAPSGDAGVNLPAAPWTVDPP